MHDKANSEDRRPGGAAGLAGHEISRIGFGAMQLPGPGVWGPPRDRALALAVLRRAVERGINHIDTAQFYGDGVSNELIRAALHPYPRNLVLVSKVGARRDAKGAWLPAQDPASLRRGVEANLRTLGVDHLAVVNLRVMDAFRDGAPVPEDQKAEFDDQLAEMIAMRDEGKIGAIGLSNVSRDQLLHALPAGIACVQNAYSLLDRPAEPLLEICLRAGIAWVPFFPLGSAFPGKPKVTAHPHVIETALRLGATPAQVGLAWLLAHAPNILLIPGTSDPGHLDENIAAGEISLDGDTMKLLDGLSA